MNGVFQADINFHNSEFYGFSEFYYTTEDVLRIAGPYDYVRFQTAAQVSIRHLVHDDLLYYKGTLPILYSF